MHTCHFFPNTFITISLYLIMYLVVQSKILFTVFSPFLLATWPCNFFIAEIRNAIEPLLSYKSKDT